MYTGCQQTEPKFVFTSAWRELAVSKDVTSDKDTDTVIERSWSDLSYCCSVGYEPDQPGEGKIYLAYTAQITICWGKPKEETKTDHEEYFLLACPQWLTQPAFKKKYFY